MIRLVADVHGAAVALRRAAAEAAEAGEPLLVLGDLINFVDYRTLEGIATAVSGRELVSRVIELRQEGRVDEARRLWREHHTPQVAARYEEAIDAAYREICGALEGCEAYVTYGNVDRPDLLKAHLPATARFVDGDVIVVGGVRVGFAGGGVPSLGTAGEVGHEEMARKLERLGDVDVLCTHVPPAIPELATDVIGGRAKGSPPVLEHLRRRRPAFHYFGDIHQPRATRWRVGPTLSRNVGYFRATERVVRHG